MKVKIADVVPLLEALKFNLASTWNVEKFNKKMQKIGDIFDDPEAFDPDSIEDKALRKLFNKMKEAYEKDEEILVIDPEEEPSDVETPKEVPETNEGEEPAEEGATEEESEEDQEEAPSENEESEVESEEDDSNVKTLVKKKKKMKPSKVKSKVNGEKPKKTPMKNGSAILREGTSLAELKSALSAKPRTHNEIVEAAGLTKKGTFYEALGKLVKMGLAKAGENKTGHRAWSKA